MFKSQTPNPKSQRNFKFRILCLFGIWYLVLGVSTLFAQSMPSAKRVVMIIAHNQFNDNEFLKPAKILEDNNIEVTVASSQMAEANGIFGTKIEPDMLIDEVNVSEYDAVIFIGGPGAEEYWQSDTAFKIAKDALASNKLLAAICLAPVTLANAGVLSAKKATVWNSEGEKLKSKGANYTGKAVEEDGNIITANGPDAAKEFGEAILKKLK